MRATYHETYGVKLGYSRPFMGGYLFQAGGRLTWSWGYPTPRAYLENRGGRW